eukprot:6207053-Pleurochrysis_carterae.AAC.3
MVLFASEATATRVALEYDADQPWQHVELCDAAMFNDYTPAPRALPKKKYLPKVEPPKAFRIDLDDVRGEVLALTWTAVAQRQPQKVSRAFLAARRSSHTPYDETESLHGNATSQPAETADRHIEMDRVMVYKMADGGEGEVHALSFKNRDRESRHASQTLRSRALVLTEENNMLHIPPLRLTDTVRTKAPRLLQSTLTAVEN